MTRTPVLLYILKATTRKQVAIRRNRHDGNKAKGTIWVNGTAHKVTFLFDSGAKPSLISVAAAGLVETGSKAQFVSGIGGKQAVGDVISCNFTFDCKFRPKKNCFCLGRK